MTVYAETDYFGKKKALWGALRLLAEKELRIAQIEVKLPKEKIIYRFSRKKLEEFLGFEIYSNFEKVIKEGLPKSKYSEEGLLYHKKNILEAFKCCKVQ